MSEVIKYQYNKHNVLTMLEEKMNFYNRKFMDNWLDKEKAVRYSAMHTALQNLIMDFEDQFE